MKGQDKQDTAEHRPACHSKGAGVTWLVTLLDRANLQVTRLEDQAISRLQEGFEAM